LILYIYFIASPIKYAVRIEDIYKYQNCILVKETWHTGTGWEQVGDDKGLFLSEQLKDVHLIGKTPPLTSFGGDHVNTYLCEGDYNGKHKIEGSSEIYNVFEVLEWYPIYPVKRDTILPSWLYPKGYLSKCDKIE